MSLKIKGTNAHGHIGWFTYYCRICNRRLKIGSDLVYRCPKDEKKLQAYFCEADARGLKFKCPHCGSELELMS
jgi:predicted RNA-binding Zn-ribbon protein involved in translation (DUF1610 family)